MKLTPEEIEEILTRVVRSYLLRKVAHIESREDKAKEIAFMCSVGGGTDTCNLICAFEDLSKEVARKIGELQDGIKVGSWVHCSDGLGQVKELENGCATVHIHTFGRRTYSVGKLTIAQ